MKSGPFQELVENETRETIESGGKLVALFIDEVYKVNSVRCRRDFND